MLVGESARVSFAPPTTPPLDSRFRENDDAGALAHSQAAKAHFRTNRSCRLVPAHQGMKSRSCGLVQRIGTADSATPHADPSGGQAPALHFLIPPSAIGLQFGTFRPWRAGIEVDWRAHPGSESGTCFHRNGSCRLAPAHQGMKMGVWLLEVFGCGWCHPSPLDSGLAGMTN